MVLSIITSLRKKPGPVRYVKTKKTAEFLTEIFLSDKIIRKTKIFPVFWEIFAVLKLCDPSAIPTIRHAHHNKALTFKACARLTRVCGSAQCNLLSETQSYSMCTCLPLFTTPIV